jgi:hypothetical protein
MVYTGCFNKSDAVPILILDHDNPPVRGAHLSASVDTTRPEVGDLLVKTGNGQRQ